MAPKQVRYVGQTTTPYERWRFHVGEAKGLQRTGYGRNRRTQWLASVLEAGRTPRPRTLARVRPEGALAAERRHYLRCVLAGHDLTNDVVPGLGQSLRDLLRAYPHNRAQRLRPPPTCQSAFLEALQTLAHGGYPGAQEALDLTQQGPSCCDGPAGPHCTRLSPAQHRRRERTVEALAERIAAAVAAYCATHGPLDDRTVAQALLEAARLLN